MDYPSPCERRVQSNVRASQELLRLTDPSAAFGLQRGFIREYRDTLMQGSATFIRPTRQVADQSLRPIEIQSINASRSPVKIPCGQRCDDLHVRLAGPEDTVQRASQLMREEDTGVLPVGEGDCLVGIVTDCDVALRLARKASILRRAPRCGR